MGLASNGDYVACGEWHYAELVKTFAFAPKTISVWLQSEV